MLSGEEAETTKKKLSISIVALLLLTSSFLLISIPRGPVVTVCAFSGDITSDQVISTNGTIDGNTTIKPGVTVTILPGIVIKFMGNYHLSVEGTLEANGTEQKPIEFISGLATPSPGDWLSIRFKEGSKGWIKNSTFSNSTHGVNIFPNSNGTVLKNNTMEDISTNGIKVSTAANCTISGNTISDCGKSGVRIIESTGIDIRDNNISNVPVYGVEILNSNDARLIGNRISNINTDGILVKNSSDIDIIDNNVTNIDQNGINLWQDARFSQVCSNNVSFCKKGIRLITAHNNSIIQNKIWLCGSLTSDGGIYLENSDHNDILKNHVFNNLGRGITNIMVGVSPPPHNNTIADNQIWSNTYTGIFDYLTVDSGICNNTLSNNFLTDIGVGLSKRFQVVGNIISESLGYGIYILSSDTGNISENEIDNGPLDGIYVYESNNITLYDNMITGSNYSGINLTKCINITVHKNTIDGSFVGVNITQLSNECYAIENHIFNTRSSGIEVHASGARIWDNDVSLNDGRGLFGRYAPTVEVRGNAINGNNENGIILEHSDEARLSNNEITNNKENGLLIFDSINVTSENDTVTGSSNFDIGLWDSSDLETINTTFDHASCSLSTDSELTCYYYLGARVLNETGIPVVCNISVCDSLYNSWHYNQTSSFDWLKLQGYRRHGSNFDYTPEDYKITAMDGDVEISRFVNMSLSSQYVDLTILYPPFDQGLPDSISFAEDSSYIASFEEYVSCEHAIELTISEGLNIGTELTGDALGVRFFSKIPDWNGQEMLNFTFSSANGEAMFKNINVVVEPRNDPPVICSPIDNITSLEGIGRIFLNLSQCGDDPDLQYEGDKLCWVIMAPSEIFEVEGNNQTENISLVIKDRDYFGKSEITVTLFDSSGTFQSQNVGVHIDNVNDPPKIFPIPDQDTNNEGLLNMDLTDWVFDIDDPVSDLRLSCSSGYAQINGKTISFNYTGSTLAKENVTVTVTDNHSEDSKDSTWFWITVHLPVVIIDDDDDMEDNDTDKDGLPDYWELTWFGDLSQGADDDYDSDGLTNLEEFSGGTDPTVPESGPLPDDDDADDDTEDKGWSVFWVLIPLFILLMIIAIAILIVFRRRREGIEAGLSSDDAVDVELESDELFKEKDAIKVMDKKKKKTMMVPLGSSFEQGDTATYESVPQSDESFLYDSTPALEEEPAYEVPPGVESPVLEAEGGGGLMEGDMILPSDLESGMRPPLALPPAQIFEAEFTDSPTIDEIFIITQTGMLLKHFRYKETSLIDEDILAGMLVVIQSFITDSFGKKKTTLKRLEFGDFNMLMTQGEFLSIVIISSDEDLKPLKKPTNLMVKEIETINEGIFKDWDGTLDSFFGIEDCVTKLVNEGY